MSFGVYVHIPYCLQRCTYCDFATYEKSKILPSNEYVLVVQDEIKQTSRYFEQTPLDTLYFGGGTPSLIPSVEIVSIIRSLEKAGFPLAPNAEATIEINPATIDKKKLQEYLDHGINRFSVGAQTFDDRLLRSVKREHNAAQTIETLKILRQANVNFSFDILFGLPGQTIEGVRRDLEIAVEMGSSHISPYCLTVPSGHPLSKGRPPEEVQVAMFDEIHQVLGDHGFHRYEISNYSKPGYESKHNMLYWTDQPYWGLGLSAHSYMNAPLWGKRFWNESNIVDYVARIESQRGKVSQDPSQHRNNDYFETLEAHQSLTDFCHTALRVLRGLDIDEITKKFGHKVKDVVQQRLEELIQKKWLRRQENGPYSLTDQGLLVSNKVFEHMTFLRPEILSLQG